MTGCNVVPVSTRVRVSTGTRAGAGRALAAPAPPGSFGKSILPLRTRRRRPRSALVASTAAGCKY
jgi:hypothetical protein